VIGIAGLIPVFVLSVTAHSIWMLLPIFGIPIISLLIGLGIYNNCAELYLLSKKSGPHSGANYKRGLRQLERERKDAVRKLWSMKNYSYGSSYYLDVIAIEKKIATHKGIDYVRPEYLPDRYS
jgi:hypothetical protein